MEDVAASRPRTPMKCLYINLDSAPDRRASLEASFRAHAPAGWDLIRIAACGPGEVAGLDGAISPREKACWLSHRSAVESVLAEPDDVLIVEDDTCFGPRTFEMIERLCGADLAWDLIFTEVILRVENMMPFAQQYSPLAAAGMIRVFDLAGMHFAGASGYLVRGAAKRKLLACLDEPGGRDRAYDLRLSDLTLARRIRSLLCFPFITQPGAHAAESQIQPDHLEVREAAHLAFRRLMCLDRDLEALRPGLDRLEALHGDPGAAMVGRVFGAFASEAMRFASTAPPKASPV